MMNRLTPEYVTEIPEPMEPGKIYISKPFKLAMHLCACGCGGEVTTRLGPGGWALTEHPGSVSLFPSIGPSTLRCRSHYVLRRGGVDWLPPMTERQIVAVQAKDAAYRKSEFQAARGAWYARFGRWLTRLFRGAS